ncbi:MAG TPA: FtsX-like permease family protein [Nitrospiraceae bacterium]|nr:FtsX-like permease family protein [Nitrospiraceae bacterium]
MNLAYPLMLFRLGLAHMVERPLRTSLTIVGVALGVAAFVAVRTANVEVLRSFEQSVTAVSGAATLEIVGHDAGLNETVITDVRRLPGIVSADPIVTIETRVTGGSLHGQGVALVGLDLIEMMARERLTVRRGRAAQELEGLLAADRLFLGPELASEWGVAQGDRLRVLAGLQEIPLVVEGILEVGEGARSIWSRTAVMDIAAAQKAFGLVGKLDRIELITDSSQNLEQLQDQVQRSLPPSAVVQRPDTRGRQVENMVRAFQTNLTVLSGVGLLVGIFLIYNTISFSVIQRRREIGIFRAIGMSEQTVSALFIGEAAVMGSLGGLLGALLGVWVATGLTGLLGNTITELYASVPRSGIGRGAGSLLPLLFQGGVLGSLISALGAVAPSAEAGKTVVVQALAPGSYDVVRKSAAGSAALIGGLLLACSAALLSGGPIDGIPVFGYGAAFCLLAGLSGLIPLSIQAMNWWNQFKKPGKADSGGATLERIASEQLTRSSSRSTVTVSALLVGVAIMVGVVMMVRSFRHTVEIWIEETVIADLIVTPQAWLQGSRANAEDRTLPSSWADELRHVEGVAAVDLYRDVHLRLGETSVALVSRDLRLHAERSRYLVLAGDSTTILREAAESGGVLLSEVLADRLNVKAGQGLELPTPSGLTSFPVLAVFYDYATDGGKIVMDRATYRRWWPADDAVTVLPVYVSARAQADRVRGAILRRLAELTPTGPGAAVVSNGELRQEILEIFDRTFFLTYALEAIAVLIAVLGIVNTLVTSVLERRREFAILQAIGASERQIQTLVLWEASYLGVIGAFLGIIGGIALSHMLIAVINKQSFGWTIQIEWTPGVWMLAVLVSVGVAVVAGYWPARWASHQPAVEGLRYE